MTGGKRKVIKPDNDRRYVIKEQSFDAPQYINRLSTKTKKGQAPSLSL